MPDIHLIRPHTLGLSEARRLSAQWVTDAQQRFGLQCAVETGDEGDTVQFSRSGVSGEMRVRADAFELHAKLGFLLGSFAATIEAEIARKLDALLGAAGQGPAPA